MRQHRTSACLMYHDCWTFREALFGGKDSIPGRSGGRLRDRALRICRDYSAHGTRRNGIYRLSEYHGSPEYGAPGLRCAGTTAHTGVHDCLGVCGAPGLRCTGSTVHWDPRLPWRLRCAGTSVRRDFGAPGLRCTEATSSAASTHGRPGSPHSSEQRAAPAVPVPRTGLLDLAASHGRPPPESSIFGGSWIRREPPLSISGRPTRAAARLPAAHQRLALSGPEYFC